MNGTRLHVLFLAAVLGPASVLAAPPNVGDTPQGRAIVQMQCVRCHASGEMGAPRIGDRGAWIDRAHLGIDRLVNSAIRGHGAMPARGGMAMLTDPEIRAAVTYMVSTSLNTAQ
jgi:cytochrome c5